MSLHSSPSGDAVYGSGVAFEFRLVRRISTMIVELYKVRPRCVSPWVLGLQLSPVVYLHWAGVFQIAVTREEERHCCQRKLTKRPQQAPSCDYHVMAVVVIREWPRPVRLTC